MSLRLVGTASGPTTSRRRYVLAVFLSPSLPLTFSPGPHLRKARRAQGHLLPRHSAHQGREHQGDEDAERRQRHYHLRDGRRARACGEPGRQGGRGLQVHRECCCSEAKGQKADAGGMRRCTTSSEAALSICCDECLLTYFGVFPRCCVLQPRAHDDVRILRGTRRGQEGELLTL